MSEKQPLLQLKEIAKQYDSPDGKESSYVLKNINLSVEEGESVAIIGPSGSGKSTLLNLIGTLDSPCRGHIILENQDLSQYDDKQLANLRNQQIGFIFQLHHLLPQCTVLENVIIPTLANKSKELKELIIKLSEDESIKELDQILKLIGDLFKKNQITILIGKRR